MQAVKNADAIVNEWVEEAREMAREHSASRTDDRPTDVIDLERLGSISWGEVQEIQERIESAYRETLTPLLIERAVETLPEKTDLVYVDYREELSREQVALLLADDMEAFWESTWEWEADSQAYAIDYLWKEALDGFEDEERELLEDDESAFERFREEAQERDNSDWFGQLCRNTPNVMIRYDLGLDVESYMVAEEDVETIARQIARAAGIDWEANASACRSLVGNASYGGRLCVLHSSDIQDVLSVCDGGEVVFTDPYLLVYDGLNGSGHDEEVSGAVRVRIGSDTMRHDAGRYSWSDDIAGVVHSAYETPAEFVPATSETVGA